MKCSIPAKTFLLGEYAALAGEPAIVLTTKPYFTASLCESREHPTPHPNSPAGLFWEQSLSRQQHLGWDDPYQGIGGLGASSAQFIGAYLLDAQLQNHSPTLHSLLEAYYQYAWSGKGLKPSGYDVIAQTQGGCVLIHKNHQTIQCYPWVFEDLSFFIVHTGTKLATHQHLQQTTLPSHIDLLSSIVSGARYALEKGQTSLLIEAVNLYQATLAELGLIAPQSQAQIAALKQSGDIKAIKGCGALGADTLLIICDTEKKALVQQQLIGQNKMILASEQTLAALADSAFAWQERPL